MPARPKAPSPTKETRTGLYAARDFLIRDVQEELQLRIPFDVYFQDPALRALSRNFGQIEQGSSTPGSSSLMRTCLFFLLRPGSKPGSLLRSRFSSSMCSGDALTHSRAMLISVLAIIKAR